MERLLYIDPVTGQKIAREPDIPFYRNQTRIVFGNNKRIDPKNIEDYIALGGYGALGKALRRMSPEQVLAEVKKADLRGSGGGGFPAGKKWEETRNAPGDIKYVIVNCDEGDPGRLHGPVAHGGQSSRVLEGLLIGAYAIGAREGFVYVGQEYPLACDEPEHSHQAGPGIRLPRERTSWDRDSVSR